MIEDPYLDTQSWVLRNRLHISDRGVLREAEDLVVSARIAELDLVDLPTRGEADKDENDLACQEGAEGRFDSLEQLLSRILVPGETLPSA